MAKRRIGIWLIGARGGVATTAIVGLVALRNGQAGTTGLVSELPSFAGLDLPDWEDLVVGGHEIRSLSLLDTATRLAGEQAIDHRLLGSCQDELEQIDARIRPGTLYRVGPTIAGLADLEIPRDETPREAVARLQADLEAFATSNHLEHVVVVNVASTEPPMDLSAVPPSWRQLEPLLDSPEQCPVPASSLYAIAAFESGCSYINFTPALGATPAALDELAQLRGSRHMGYDGKTGETLLKSTLAPMFARRNLQVLSWVGHNIFGNLDGRVLDNPVNKAAKVRSKDHLLSQILPQAPQTLVSIEYIESMGDWKTAWDHLHFAGFLGTRMTMQFTWQGCDSLLAAPLVLDLVRFTELARRRGETGTLKFLGSFFKSPLGVEEQSFERQFLVLEQWACQGHDQC